jgi:hypothetical protein
MKKTLIALCIASVTMLACKKNDDPAPPKVVKTLITLEAPEKNADQTKSLTWYSALDGKAYSMEQILANKAISEKIDFGADMSAVISGLFSPLTHQVQYGQDTWTKKNATTFKLSDINAKSFKDEPETFFTVEFVNKAYAAAAPIVPGTEAAGPNALDGTVLAFKTAGGNLGLVWIVFSDPVAKTINLDVRFIK